MATVGFPFVPTMIEIDDLFRGRQFTMYINALEEQIEKFIRYPHLVATAEDDKIFKALHRCIEFSIEYLRNYMNKLGDLSIYNIWIRYLKIYGSIAVLLIPVSYGLNMFYSLHVKNVLVVLFLGKLLYCCYLRVQILGRISQFATCAAELETRRKYLVARDIESYKSCSYYVVLKRTYRRAMDELLENPEERKKFDLVMEERVTVEKEKKALLEKIADLETQVIYMPNGEGYFDAKNDFEDKAAL
ncbi:MAG: hypothetical protein Harvfovirus15_33 [Harvfovirus sp.]|uniref:Uncharacterized protein n=1 Tax=Harvfovirus sp. TaxID=2487768 RepID=A0A3G5A6K5_9VIRU|nr:MAG: hypothetical protein Harvfovirus15_33 [Harvfovirus sp.]